MSFGQYCVRIATADARQHRGRVTLATLIYLTAGLALAWLLRDRLNPDGICYNQMARHFLEGDFGLGVNSWWSPGLPGLLLPGLLLGIEPMLWARMIQIPAGLLFALGVGALVREAHGPNGTLAGFLLALAAALAMQTGPITPDGWHAVVLTWYFVLTQRLLRQGGLRRAAGAGTLGGLAYLVKAYSLPFVLVHLSFTYALRRLDKTTPRPEGRALSEWGTAVALVLAISAPWVALISSQDHELTISSAGRYWTVAQPVEPTDTAPVLGLFEIPSGRLTTLENIRALPLEWKPAPPFGGLAIWKDQLKTIRRNLSEISSGLDRLDGVGLTKMFVLMSVLLILPLRATAGEPGVVALRWALGSVFIYLCGYTLTYFVDRFLYAIWGLLIVLCVAGPEAILRRLVPGLPGATAGAGLERFRLSHGAALVVLTLLIAASMGRSVLSFYAGGSHRRATELKAAAARIPAGSAIASTDWYAGLNFTFWSRGRYLGGASGQTAESLEAELRPFGPSLLLVPGQPALAGRLGNNPAFQRIDLGCPWAQAFVFSPSSKLPEGPPDSRRPPP